MRRLLLLAVVLVAGCNPDTTKLPVGDGKISTSPQRGYLWSCQTTFDGGGASTKGPWFNADGSTWDLSKKATVDGSVSWPSRLSITTSGTSRVVSGNDLPSHRTGTFPVASSDDAYRYDRNPNAISEQVLSFSIPLQPALAAAPSCVGGEVGVMLTGSMLFNAVDAGGRDAVAWEVQDGCDGHPQEHGAYHYHSVSDCATDTGTGHSALVGYALDGFGIYGYRASDGGLLTNGELDECHGHTHEITWEGRVVSMFHYHATREFPYTVGCFCGTAARVSTGGGTSPSTTLPPPPRRH